MLVKFSLKLRIIINRNLFRFVLDNFFLAYLLTLGVAMLPGLHRRGILQKHCSQLSIKFGELLKGQNILKKEM